MKIKLESPGIMTHQEIAIQIQTQRSLRVKPGSKYDNDGDEEKTTTMMMIQDFENLQSNNCLFVDVSGKTSQMVLRPVPFQMCTDTLSLMDQKKLTWAGGPPYKEQTDQACLRMIWI